MGDDGVLIQDFPKTGNINTRLFCQGDPSLEHDQMVGPVRESNREAR